MITEGKLSFFGFRCVCFVSEGARAESHRALGLFSILRFLTFLFFFSAKKMTALKWPRPGGFHIRDAILVRRHSRFSFFLAKLMMQNHRFYVFFLQKMRRREIGAVPRLALSGRHFDAPSRAANPTVPWVIVNC